jgi:hypothetical protein
MANSVIWITLSPELESESDFEEEEMQSMFFHIKEVRSKDMESVNGLQALYSSYLTQMLFTVEMKGKREGGCHLMLFVFAHGPLIVEAR